MDYSKAIAFFEPDTPYLLSTHRNADGDGIGALLALGGVLDHLGRKFRIIVGDEQPDIRFSFLAGFDRIESSGSLTGRPAFDRVVFVDTPTYDIGRVGDAALMLAQGAQILVIDHHAGRGDRADVRLVDSNASAASELIYGLARAADVPVSADMAKQIYAGIAFDTKLFKFSHPERAVKVCAELVDCGADPEEIADILFARESFETMKSLGAALSTLEMHMDNRVSTLVVDHQTYKMGGDLDIVVDHAMSIDGVEVAVFFKEETPGRYRVSLRSRGNVDVNEIARVFGGGGHQRASGCEIIKPLEEARKALLAEVEKRIPV
jgi:phosphoesterase RecJ-like protein